MKRKVVELDAKSKRKERGLGDAPALGQVAKVSGAEKTAEPVYAELEEEEPVAGDWLIKLGMISALLIGLIVGGAVIYYTAVSKLNDGHMAVSDKQRPKTPAAEHQEGEAAGMISQTEALDLVRRGLAVRFASKVNDYFRYAGTLDGPHVIDFLKGLSETDGLVARMEWLGPLVVGGQSLARVRVHFMAGATRSSRDVYLVQDSSGDSMGEWKIDFDSFAKSQQPDFKPQQEEKLNKP